MDGPCALCGEPADDAHHITGRGPSGHYLDPDLSVPLCHDDHELAGDDLRAESLEKPLKASAASQRVAYRLRRTALFLVRVSESTPVLCWLAALAVAMRRWADELLDEDPDVSV